MRYGVSDRMADTMEGKGQPVSVSLDERLCGATGMCARVAPEVFALPDGATTASVLQHRLTDPAQIELAQAGEQSCPTMAILVERSD
jgi:ferredoxin